jgi:hypothetical protein
MSEIIKIFDGGFGSIEHGKCSIIVGQIIFRVSENESKPIDHIAYCKPCYKDSIIKNLKHLCFPQTKASTLSSQDTYKLRAASVIDALSFLDEIQKQIKSYAINSMPDHPELPSVELTFATELTIDEIRQALESVYEGHLMVDTVQPIEKYTGEINGSNNDELS